MKIVENKKLFGKINLMDIFIIIVFAILALVVYKVVFEEDTSVAIGAKYFTTTCVLKVDDMPEGASTYLKNGADVYDNETNVYVGKLVSYSSGDYMTIIQNRETKEFVQTKVPNKETVYLTVEVDVSDQGADLITANNYYIKVGKYVSVRCHNFAGSGYVTTIERGEK